MRNLIVSLTLCCLAPTAQAATFGLNASTKALLADFEASFSPTASSSVGSASGSTNGGVTWSTNIDHFLPFSSGSGTGNIGTSNASNTAPQSASEWIHTGSGFTLTFSESIAAILFVTSDNDNGPSVLMEHSTAPTLEGSALSLSSNQVTLGASSGGFLLYEGLSGTTFESVFPSGPDGANLAFAVLTTADAAPVPVPAGLPLLIAGLGALGLVVRRRAKPV